MCVPSRRLWARSLSILIASFIGCHAQVLFENNQDTPLPASLTDYVCSSLKGPNCLARQGLVRASSSAAGIDQPIPIRYRLSRVIHNEMRTDLDRLFQLSDLAGGWVETGYVEVLPTPSGFDIVPEAIPSFDSFEKQQHSSSYELNADEERELLRLAQLAEEALARHQHQLDPGEDVGELSEATLEQLVDELLRESGYDMDPDASLEWDEPQENVPLESELSNAALDRMINAVLRAEQEEEAEHEQRKQAHYHEYQ